MKKIRVFASSLIWLVVAAWAGPEGAGRPAYAIEPLPAFQKHCTRCHTAQKSMALKWERDVWAETIARMAARHGRVFSREISLRDQESIADYLAVNAGRTPTL